MAEGNKDKKWTNGTNKAHLPSTFSPGIVQQLLITSVYLNLNKNLVLNHTSICIFPSEGGENWIAEIFLSLQKFWVNSTSI